MTFLYDEDLLLDEFLQVIEPIQVLLAVFVYHVLMQEIGGTGFDASDRQILMEGFLQVLIQIPSENNQRKIVFRWTESITNNSYNMFSSKYAGNNG